MAFSSPIQRCDERPKKELFSFESIFQAAIEEKLTFHIINMIAMQIDLNATSKISTFFHLFSPRKEIQFWVLFRSIIKGLKGVGLLLVCRYVKSIQKRFSIASSFL